MTSASAVVVPESILHRGFELFKLHAKEKNTLSADDVRAVATALQSQHPASPSPQGEGQWTSADVEALAGQAPVGFHTFLAWLAAHSTASAAEQQQQQQDKAPRTLMQLVEQGFRYFLLYDKDKNGAISEEEFDVMIRDLGVLAAHQHAAGNAVASSGGRTEEEEIHHLFKRLDRNKSGVLEFDELMRWLLGTGGVLRPQQPQPAEGGAEHGEKEAGATALRPEDEQLLSEKQDFLLSLLQSAFDLYQRCDTDRSGYVEQAEYAAMLAQGYTLPPWEAIDADGSGRVEFRELFQVVLQAGGTSSGTARPAPRRARANTLSDPVFTGTVSVKIGQATGLTRPHWWGKDDTYAYVRVADMAMCEIATAQTEVHSNNPNPNYNKLVELPLDNARVYMVQVGVYDGSKRSRGAVAFHATRLLSEVVSGTFKLKKGGKDKDYGTIELEIKYTPAAL